MSRPSTAALSRPVTASFSRPITPSFEGRRGSGMPMLPGCSQPETRTNFAKPHIFDITHDGLATESANKVAVARTLRGDLSLLPDSNVRNESPSPSHSTLFNPKRPFTPTFVANGGKVASSSSGPQSKQPHVLTSRRCLSLLAFITSPELPQDLKFARYLCIVLSKTAPCACAKTVEIWSPWDS